MVHGLMYLLSLCYLLLPTAYSYSDNNLSHIPTHPSLLVLVSVCSSKSFLA
jgi:hypothetical protein